MNFNQRETSESAELMSDLLQAEAAVLICLRLSDDFDHTADSNVTETESEPRKLSPHTFLLSFFRLWAMIQPFVY